MRVIFIILFFIASLLCLSNYANADLKALMEVGKSQTAIAKALKEETKNYNRVKEAILSEGLKEGMSADTVRKKYGKPIIELYDEKKDAYRWLYMPQTSSHFKGEKLYLFVDKNGALLGWQLVNQ